MTVPLQTLQVPQVCRMLRTKTAFGAYSLETDPIPWQAGESTTAVFWCLRTMATAGPDDDLAHPARCLTGRTCFESPIES